MPNILLTRIDERLIHGQVQMWIKMLGCNLVLVANDDVANDTLSQTLMKTTIPDSIQMRFFTIEHTCEVINKASDKQLIYLVVKSPEDALQLVKGGVPIDKINLGNVHNKEGKEKFSRSIYLDIKDRKALKEIYESGVEIDTASTPMGNTGEHIVDIKEIIKGV